MLDSEVRTISGEMRYAGSRMLQRKDWEGMKASVLRPFLNAATEQPLGHPGGEVSSMQR